MKFSVSVAVLQVTRTFTVEASYCCLLLLRTYVRTHARVSSMSLEKSRLQCGRRWCCNKDPVTKECTHVQQSGIYMHYCTYVRVYVCTYAHTYVYCFAFSHRAPGTSPCYAASAAGNGVEGFPALLSDVIITCLLAGLVVFNFCLATSSAYGFPQPPLPTAILISVAKSYLNLDSCSTSYILV